jgi:16S rRNA U1498 N3-methylase RsmE
MLNKKKTGKHQKTVESSLDLTIKEVAQIGVSSIVQIMRDEQAKYLKQANKLERAIKLLESL